MRKPVQVGRRSWLAMGGLSLVSCARLNEHAAREHAPIAIPAPAHVGPAAPAPARVELFPRGGPSLPGPVSELSFGMDAASARALAPALFTRVGLVVPALDVHVRAIDDNPPGILSGFVIEFSSRAARERAVATWGPPSTSRWYGRDVQLWRSPATGVRVVLSSPGSRSAGAGYYAACTSTPIDAPGVAKAPAPLGPGAWNSSARNRT